VGLGKSGPKTTDSPGPTSVSPPEGPYVSNSNSPERYSTVKTFTSSTPVAAGKQLAAAEWISFSHEKWATWSASLEAVRVITRRGIRQPPLGGVEVVLS